MMKTNPMAAVLARVIGYHRGDSVRITSGPYTGQTATFLKVKANGRVVVRLRGSKGKRSTSRMDLSLDDIV